MLFRPAALALAGLIGLTVAASQSTALEYPEVLTDLGPSFTITKSSGSRPTLIPICTGSEGLNYYTAVRVIDAFNTDERFKFIPVATSGTWDNIDRTLGKGECAGFIGQPDGPAFLNHMLPEAAATLLKIAALHREYALPICRRGVGFNDISDNIDTSDRSLVVPGVASGANLLLINWALQDDDYKDTQAVYNLTATQGVTTVSTGQYDCLLLAAGLGSKTLEMIDQKYGDQVFLAEASDSDFNDARDHRGEQLYEFVDIPGELFDKLTRQGDARDLDDDPSDVETVSWRAALYLDSRSFRGDAGTEAMQALSNAARLAGKALDAAFSVPIKD